MLAGFAKENITPQLGLKMAGYVGLRKSTGVLDELHVRCIYLKQKEAVFLLSYDLLYVDAVLCEQVATRIASLYQIKEENILISAIHTHSGPAQLLEKSGINQRLEYIDGDYDPILVECLVEHGVQAAKQAYVGRKEAKLSFHQQAIHDIGTNRNEKSANIDDMLSVMEVMLCDGRCALLFGYACHPTILHEENTKYSCDLLGPTYAKLEQLVEVAMFVNGACGDVSTRFTKQASSIQEVTRLGELLAAHVCEIREKLVPLEAEIQVSNMIYTCPTRCYLREEELHQRYPMDELDEKQQDLLQLYQTMQSYCEGKTLSLPIHIVKLGSVCYVYVPVELFSKLALQAKAQLQNLTIVFVSYAMDYFSYLPDRTSYHEEPIGFEAVISPFEEGCGESLIETIVQQLQQ